MVNPCCTAVTPPGMLLASPRTCCWSLTLRSKDIVTGTPVFPTWGGTMLSTSFTHCRLMMQAEDPIL